MASKSKKKKAENRARFKRNFVNGIVTIAVIAFSLLLVITAMVFFIVRNKEGQVSYPTSPLTKMMNTSYSYIEDENLDIQFQFPTIPAVINVGGTERFMSETGLVFRYNNDLSISVYEIEGSAYDLLSTEYAANLYNGDLSGGATYFAEASTMDVGYCNSFPAEYQCGVIQVSDTNNVVYRSIYTITMVLDLGFEKDVFISISTTDRSKLYDAGILLENIVFTVMDISITQESVQMDEMNETPSTQEVLVQQEQASEKTTISSSNQEEGFGYMNIEVPLLSHYADGAIVVLQYTNTAADLSKVLLQNYNKTMATSVNPASSVGIAYFVIKEGTKGNYTLQVPEEVDLGTYAARVLSYTEFVQEYGAIITMF